ncbi:unnamed protein product [Nippostrongylus brasiliensis]|uniref:Secreted protein n=1 Tax=Nippostrongylus brasiliensis TaxID=27835 RepID=A0A0N4Y8C8_NIPBR|nr:unnamed protein product [Nippostrongylus brasiliensis]
MSRVSDTSYHKLMAAPIASLNSLVLQTCSPAIPSTATTAHIPGEECYPRSLRSEEIDMKNCKAMCKMNINRRDTRT